MAMDEEDRRHNERMLYTYTRRLRLLEERRARQGENTDPALIMEVEELRLNVATLEELLAPDPSPEVQAAVRRSQGDWAMLFATFVKYGQRLTDVEGRTRQVVEQQTRDSHWRLNVTDMIERVAQQVKVTDAKRRIGQRRNLAIQAGIAALVLFDTILIMYLFFRLGGLG